MTDRTVSAIFDPAAWEPVEGFQHLTGRFINIIGAAEVAAVVVRDLLSFESAAFRHYDTAFIDQLL